MTVTIRYFAGARHAAGVEQETWPVSESLPLSTLLDQLGDVGAGRPAELAAVLARCSFLVDGIAVPDRNRLLSPGQTVDVLPPFAGG
ncbi:MAG TPA: MoaD/ThiS family protein [Mycobacteriales bacterium]|jgi:molybdopterin converting factor small subunit|nr:MoaD/ThiS family protein [Mycobacteriales bacterium]